MIPIDFRGSNNDADQHPAVSSLPFQRLRDGCTDAFRRRFGLAVADVRIAQRHARLLVAEQAGDDRERDALQHGVAREAVAYMM